MSSNKAFLLLALFLFSASLLFFAEARVVDAKLPKANFEVVGGGDQQPFRQTPANEAEVGPVEMPDVEVKSRPCCVATTEFVIDCFARTNTSDVYYFQIVEGYSHPGEIIPGPVRDEIECFSPAEAVSQIVVASNDSQLLTRSFFSEGMSTLWIDVAPNAMEVPSCVVYTTPLLPPITSMACFGRRANDSMPFVATEFVGEWTVDEFDFGGPLRGPFSCVSTDESITCSAVNMSDTLLVGRGSVLDPANISEPSPVSDLGRVKGRPSAAGFPIEGLLPIVDVVVLGLDNSARLFAWNGELMTTENLHGSFETAPTCITVALLDGISIHCYGVGESGFLYDTTLNGLATTPWQRVAETRFLETPTCVAARPYLVFCLGRTADRRLAGVFLRYN